MSKIKDLKTKNIVSLIDIYQSVIITDKTKYIELFENLMSKYLPNFYPKDELIKEINHNEIDFNSDNLNYFELLLLCSILRPVGFDFIVNFNKFIDYNERKLIENNDITSYKSFDDIEKQINIVDVRLISKELEKQVITLLNNDDWLVIKPLSYESSKKYGANTKWCTTSSINPEYFYRYFRNGNLIYCLNKKTGYKVAAYKELQDSSVTFWNQKDNRIDSFDSELPGDIIILLRNEFKNCKKSNYEFANKEDLEKEMKLNKVSYRDRNEVARRGRVRVNNHFDDEEIPNEREENLMEIGDIDTADFNPNEFLDEMLSISEDIRVIDIDEYPIDAPMRLEEAVRYVRDMRLNRENDDYAVAAG